MAKPSADDDGDGFTNLQEYLANTKPRERSSGLRLPAIGFAARGHARISWSSVGGSRYRVLYADAKATGGFDVIFVPIWRGAAEEIDPHAVGEPSSMMFVDDFSLTEMPRRSKRGGIAG